ncbi:MAG: hypothetical protein AB7L13_07015 [Acidimicrobiia bacterium]
MSTATATATLTISCDDCVMANTRACDDCVVSFFCRDTAADAVVVDVEEARQLRLLARVGLVPSLRHSRR